MNHIEVHNHYVEERRFDGEISLAYLPIGDNVSDLSSKALPKEKFEACCKSLGLVLL